VRGTSDQAEGLRRLLAPARTRALALDTTALPLSAGRAVVALASACAAAGRDVLVLDAGRGEVAGALSLTWRHGLADVLAGRCRAADAVLATPAGFRLLPAGRLSSPLEAKDLGRALAELAEAPTLVLVHCGGAQEPLLRIAAAGELLLVAGSGAESLTRVYARIKELARREGRRSFRLLVCGAKEAEARRAQQAVARTALSYAGAAVGFGGSVRAGSAPLGEDWLRVAHALEGWRLAELGPRPCAEAVGVYA